MAERYLEFLRRHCGRATFFVVGDVARAYPKLIRSIAGEGHEIACHSDRHIALGRHDAASFRDDTLRSLDALAAAGAEHVQGYRAPFFSVVEKTRWVYPLLRELGFRYSSSVLPGANPQYGWPEFGHQPRLIDGVLEIPVTLVSRLLPVPMAGGMYFRVLPESVLRRTFCNRRNRGEIVVSYLHPYDIDSAQERFAHPGFGKWSVYNWLMFRNRDVVLPRLEMVARLGFSFVSYGEHAGTLRQRISDEAGDRHG